MNALVVLVAVALQVVVPKPAGIITGRILNGSGSPAGNVRVAAMSAAEESAGVPTLVAFAVTDSTGRYRLESVAPGEYYITAGLAAQPTFYPGVAAQSGAKKVAVVAGTVLGDVDFRVVTPLTAARGARGTPPAPTPPAATPSPTFTVSGQVVLQPGQALSPNARVSLNSGLSAPIQPDGNFELTGVRGGSYSLRTNLSFFSKPTDIAVTEKHVTGLKIAIPFTAAVRARIDTEGGATPGAVSLSFKSTASPNTAVSFSSSGPFTIDLPEGTYQVVPEAMPGGYSLKSLTAGPVNLLKETLKISRTAARPEIVVALVPKPSAPRDATPALRELAGRVTTEGNQLVPMGPIVGLRFSSASGAGTAVVVDSAVSDPTFKVTLAEGEYKVEPFLLPVASRLSSLKVKAVTYGPTSLIETSLKVTAGEPLEIGILLGP